ncbi:MAG: hypothetical protein D6795_08875 [Deltaproteobacteria bacterium]|nr:MAG: hypothetical protein D6795_08875 [Deltaproteobacteria bacterium]
MRLNTIPAPFFDTLRRTFRLMCRRRSIYLSTIGIMTPIMMLVAASLLFVQNFDTFLDRWRTRVFTLSIYLTDDLPREVIDALLEEIRGSAGAQRVRFIPKGEGLAVFLRDFPEYADVLESFPANPLPDTIEVFCDPHGARACDPTHLAGRIRFHPAVEEVDLNPAWRRGFRRGRRLVRWAAFLFGGGMIAISCVIVVFTIRLSALAQVEESTVLRLLGATDRYLRAPLVVAGFVQGSVASLLGLVVLRLLFALLCTDLRRHFSFLSETLAFLPPASYGLFPLLSGSFGALCASLSARGVVGRLP